MKDSYSLDEFYSQEAAPQVANQPLLDEYSIEEFYQQPTKKESVDFLAPEQVAKRQQEGLRQLGLGARYALQGIAAPVTLGSDILGIASEAVTGRKLIEPLGLVVSEALTNIGLPEAQTSRERIAGDVVSGITGGGAIAKGGQKLLTSAVGGLTGGAVGTSREAGASLPVQVGVGLLTGMGASGGVKALSRRVGGDEPLLRDIDQYGVDNVAAFDNVRASVVKNEAKQQLIKSRLFEQAQKRGKDAYITANDINSLANSTEAAKNSVFSQKGRDVLDFTAERLKEIAATGGKDINELHVIRRGLVPLSKSADGGERQAAGMAKSMIDEFLQRPGLVKGKKESVQLWNRAIKKTIENAKTFEEPKAIARAIGSDTNETVENFFIGSAGAKNKELGNIYQQTLKALPEAERKLGGFRLRQAILNRMVKNSIRSSDSGADSLSASNLANQIRLLRTDNKTMWNKFPDSEKAALNRLEKNLRGELKGGVVNKVYNSLENFIRGGIGSNIELPRTLKAKAIVDINDLQELMSLRAGAPLGAAAIVGTEQAVENK